jgi:hypothetical protein
MRRSDIALHEAILIYVACILNEASLTPDGYAKARMSAFTEARGCLCDVLRSDGPIDLAGAPRETLSAAELSRVESIAWEFIASPAVGLETLIKHVRGLKTGEATFPRLERWKRLWLQYRSCLNELLEAHHRGDLKLSGSNVPDAPSISRRKIPRAFTFQSPSEKRRVEFGGRTLSKVIAPGPESQFRAGWSTVEAWYEVRTPAASLIRLIRNKLHLNTSAERYNACLEYLRQVGKDPPPRRRAAKDCGKYDRGPKDRGGVRLEGGERREPAFEQIRAA